MHAQSSDFVCAPCCGSLFWWQVQCSNGEVLEEPSTMCSAGEPRQFSRVVRLRLPPSLPPSTLPVPQKEHEEVILRLIAGDLQGLFELLLTDSCCCTACVLAVWELWISVSLNVFNVTRFSPGFGKQVLIRERERSVKRISLFPPPAISSFSLPTSSTAWQGNL